MFIFRQMPWYSTPKPSAGVEVSLTYQFFNGGPNGNKIHRKRSAAFVKIDRNNVSVIGKFDYEVCSKESI